MRTPGHQAEACPSSESIKRSACDAPHAKTDPAVARARASRSPETCRTRAGDEHSPKKPTARKNVWPSTQPKHRAASKSKRCRTADAVAARSHRHLRVGFERQTSALSEKLWRSRWYGEGRPSSRAPGGLAGRRLRSRAHRAKFSSSLSVVDSSSCIS